MNGFRNHPPTEIAGSKVTLIYDYASLKGHSFTDNETFALHMPTTSNVLQYYTEDNTKVSVRPSGTEPKLKCYLEVVIPVEEGAEVPWAQARERLETIKSEFGAAIGI